MSDHFYLPKHEQEQLADLLHPGIKAPPHIWAASIPSLLEDLAVAISRQDRMGNGILIRSGSDEQPLPVNLAAVEAADTLHNELLGWVKLVIEQRKLHYTGGDDTLSLARWLKRWVMALALTDGAQDALTSIRAVVKQARRTVDRPTERAPERPEEERLENIGLTKAELQEAILWRAGRQVTRKDINNWIQRGHITDLGGGYFSLSEALAYVQKDMRVA